MKLPSHGGSTGKSNKIKYNTYFAKSGIFNLRLFWPIGLGFVLIMIKSNEFESSEDSKSGEDRLVKPPYSYIGKQLVFKTLISQ